CGIETAVEQSTELRQRLSGIKWEILRLAPEDRRSCLDHQDSAAGTIGNLGNAYTPARLDFWRLGSAATGRCFGASTARGSRCGATLTGTAFEDGARSDEHLVIGLVRLVVQCADRSIYGRHRLGNRLVVRTVPRFVKFELLVKVVLLQEW